MALAPALFWLIFLNFILQLVDDGLRIRVGVDEAKVDINEEFTRLRAPEVCPYTTEKRGDAPCPLRVQDDVCPEGGGGKGYAAPVVRH